MYITTDNIVNNKPCGIEIRKICNNGIVETVTIVTEASHKTYLLITEDKLYYSDYWNNVVMETSLKSDLASREELLVQINDLYTQNQRLKDNLRQKSEEQVIVTED